MTTRRVSPNEALELIEREGYAYVDVRSAPEYEGGHPAGSYNVPFAHATPGGMRPNEDFVRVMSAVFSKDAPLVIGCLVGGRSLRACAQLEAAGFTRVVDQRAGWGGAKDTFGRVTEPGWSALGLPGASGPDATRGYEALSRKG